MSPRRVLLWAKNVHAMDGFVSGKDGSMLELADPAPVKARDLFLRINDDQGKKASWQCLAIVERKPPIQSKKGPLPARGKGRVS